MSSRAMTFNDSVEDQLSTERKKLPNAVRPIKEMVSNLSRATADKIDENLDPAAGRLEKTASALGESAESLAAGEKVSSFAHAAAEKLNSSADDIRKYNVKRMMVSVVTVAKNNPGPSLLVAAVIGFFVARAFASNDRGEKTK